MCFKKYKKTLHKNPYKIVHNIIENKQTPLNVYFKVRTKLSHYKSKILLHTMKPEYFCRLI